MALPITSAPVLFMSPPESMDSYDAYPDNIFGQPVRKIHDDPGALFLSEPAPYPRIERLSRNVDGGPGHRLRFIRKRGKGQADARVDGFFGRPLTESTKSPPIYILKCSINPSLCVVMSVHFGELTTSVIFLKARSPLHNLFGRGVCPNHCIQDSGPTGTTERLYLTALSTALATLSGGQPNFL